MEVLLEELARRGIRGVRRVGVGHDLPDYDEAAELEKVERALSSG